MYLFVPWPQFIKYHFEKTEPLLKEYLVTSGDLHDDWETVVIGGCVAKDVHDGSHLLYPVQAGNWRTHHLSGKVKKQSKTVLGKK